MNTREFYVNVSKGMVNEEIKSFAEEAIKKLDERNEARKLKPSKTAIENAPIKEKIFEKLSAAAVPMTELELGAALELTLNKAGSLARQLVKEGRLTVEDVKIPKVGVRKAYRVIK